MRSKGIVLFAFVLGAALVTRADAAPRSFPAGSLIIPMDLDHQDTGMLQAYGLLFQLARQGVPVAWVIDPDKTAYPNGSADFTTSAVVVWDSDGGAPGTAVTSHGYRGGPFVIDAAHRDAALAIIAAWNDQAMWPANPWAQRSVFHVVSVHETSAAFSGDVSREIVAAPTIAVFSDGNEDIATGYLRAAGIKQSNGSEFPAGRCGGAGTCGPGTANPDMLTVPSVAGDMGTCGNPSNDHRNGALFTADGLPAYCQIMSMHWNVADRETVQCGGGNCPATQAQCPADTPITYHGHEVVAEVRAFLAYPVHFFAECQAVNAYENTTPNPAWPFLDDAGRDGHFLTTTGTPPACPCTEAGFTCVSGGCNGADCCLPQDLKERGAGFLIAARPDTYRVFHPEVPYNQLDGAFETIGGSEPAYNLSAYLGTMYKNDRQVTLLSGPDGPGDQDIWMSGYLDGSCDLTEPIGGPGGQLRGPGAECTGKISYLGGHAYGTATPMSTHPDSQGARLFLNALFEADCVTSVGQPAFTLGLTPLVVPAQALPVEASVVASYDNGGAGVALEAVLREQVGAGVTVVAATGGDVAGDTASWEVGSISGFPAHPGDPSDSGNRAATLRFADHGSYTVTLSLEYRVGTSILTTPPQVFTIQVKSDRDGDGIPDDEDPFPDGGGDGDGGDEAGGCCQGGKGASGAVALALLLWFAINARGGRRARAG